MTPAKLGPPPDGTCYLRDVEGKPLAETGWRPVSLDEVKSRLSERLADFQYSTDGIRWCSTSRLNPKISHEVFLSCSGRDYDKAGLIQKNLKREGIRSYVAEKQLGYSSDYKNELFRAIDRSLVFVVLLSAETYKKPEWVMREFDLAEELKKKIVPWILDDAPLPIEFTGRLGTIQRINYEKGAPWQTHIEKLINFVFEALQEPPSRIGWSVWLLIQRQRLYSRAKQITIRGALIAILVSVAVYITFIAMRPKPVLPPTPENVDAAVVVARPHQGIEAHWYDEQNKLQSEPRNYSEDDLLEKFSQSFIWDAGSPNGVDRLFSDLYRDVDSLKSNQVRGFVIVGSGETPTISETAQALSIETMTLEKLGAVVSSHLSYKKASTHDLSSYVIVHINRHRILLVCPRKGSVKNFVNWPVPSQEATLFEKLKSVEEQKGPSMLSNRFVILCGEIPALAARSAVETSISQLSKETKGDICEAHKPILFLYDIASRPLESLFSTPLLDVEEFRQACTKDEHLNLFFADRASLNDNFGLIYNEQTRAAMETVRSSLLDIMRELRVNENERDVIFLPFVY